MKSSASAALMTVMILAATSCSDKHSVSLETVTVGKDGISQTVTATGTLESVTSVDVGTQVTGIIDRLYADFNSVVKKGELIAELDKTILQADLTSAEASVESARATYEYNLTNYNRDKALHDQRLISDYEFQTSEKDLKVSREAYDKAKADRVRAAKNLNYAEIYSPIDGIVISREVEVGQTVVSNMNVANLYTIADLDNMQVIGNVDEADIGQVKVGQKVVFSVDAYPDDSFEGQVTQVRLSPSTESNVVTYEVVVSTTNKDHKLIPGLTANLSIYVLQEENAISLPDKAFSFVPAQDTKDSGTPRPGKAIDPASLNENEKTVWVVKGNQLVCKVVKTGKSNGMRTEGLTGLKEGDIVATGYDTPEDNDSDANTQESPFAPKHPGKNRKK